MVFEARLIGKGQEDLLSKGLGVLHANRPYLNDPAAPDDLVTTNIVMQDITKRGKPGKKEFAIVVGTDLDDPEKRKVNGFVNGIYFPNSGTGVLTYLEVAPELKGSDMERQMFDLAVQQLAKTAKASGSTMRAMFVELEDPSLYTDPVDIANANRDLAFYKGNGIKAVEVGEALAGTTLDYRQPWWYKQDGLLKLHSIPDNQGNIATPADVKGFYADLHAYHSNPKLNNRKTYAPVRAQCERDIEAMDLAYQQRLQSGWKPSVDLG